MRTIVKIGYKFELYRVWQWEPRKVVATVVDKANRNEYGRGFYNVTYSFPSGVCKDVVHKSLFRNRIK